MWRPQLLKLDLTEEKILPKEPISPKVVENFLGGRGITVYIGYHTIPTDASPRGPDNAVILGTGFLSGSRFPSTGMAAATFKSPQTNTLCTSVATGRLGACLKHVDIDFLQLSGIAKTPKYVLIDEFADVTLENAESIWKKGIHEADKWLREKHGKDACIATIGSAAISKVMYAGVAVDLNHFFRRGGLGTVLASKNIKAIVFTEEPQIKEIEGITSDFINEFNQFIENLQWFEMLKSSGTFSIIHQVIAHKVLPTKNCSRILRLETDKLSSFQGYNKPFYCWQCSLYCNRNSYQDFVALGPNLKIIDSEAIQQAIESCDQEALDPLSTGAALASLFNIQEDRRKLLDIELGYNWGDLKIYTLINEIITNNGIGELLARGENYLYQQTSEPSPMIKNQMGGMFYYPNILGLSLATGTSPYGASNFRSDYMIFPELLGLPFYLNAIQIRGKAKTVILFENLQAILDSLIICSRFLPLILDVHRMISWFPKIILKHLYQLFPTPFIGSVGLELKTLLPLLQSEKTEKMTLRNLLKIGNRITLLERIFNTRTGMEREEDCFNNFLKTRPDFYKQLDKLLSDYYHAKGLTSRGLVRKKTLRKTGLLGLITI
ncbi:MAG: aldehyde ferredoxin oxidoreductase N-terminal domain-containing protein [Candidatus Hodarchaeota archaeon]